MHFSIIIRMETLHDKALVAIRVHSPEYFAFCEWTMTSMARCLSHSA